MILRILIGVISFLLILGIAWVGGLDFERGADQAFALIIALIIAVYAACAPFIGGKP